ncbi:MAG TPA: tetratricopeptide repeat protein [Trebonia sp.]|nr:tetratricopeptide repeat protein [Trebonia sp.]
MDGQSDGAIGEPRDAADEPPAAWLRRVRADRGLSQEQLARLLGVSFATVNRWETGRTQMPARARQALTELAAGGTLKPQAPSPAPKSGAATQGTPPLPLAQSSFIGRDRELAELMPLLRDSRLVTLTGPGGSGKTRLAVEALTRLNPAGPVVFVPLESVRQPDSLLGVLAAALRAPDQAGVPLATSVAAALADTPRIVMLDGAEHLRDAVAALAGQLLTAVPGLRMLVTSRLVLGVPGEVCWTVPPLHCPSAAAGASDIAASDAVRLFAARAADRIPGFSLADVPVHVIGELCRRLDGLPLAIELIASWVATLSVQEILQQRLVLLDSSSPADATPRGRRLVDVVRTSYDLLSPDEQRLLAALSVFAGPFTAADAQGVSDAGATLAHLLRGLVDSSWLMVTRGGEHNIFSMLETMRTFAAARLAESGAALQARRQHAGHFTALAEGSENGLAGPDAADWMARLETAAADLDQALQWSLDQGEAGLALRMAAALWRWWLARGRLGHGRAWLGKALAAAGQRRDELAGRAFCSAALLAAENGDYSEAIRQGRLALRILEPLGGPERTATAATVLGSAYRFHGDRAAARQSFAKAFELRAGLGDRRPMSAALNNMALVEMDDGDLPRARELLEQALAIKRQLGDRLSLAIGLVNLGELLTRMSHWDAADRALTEAAALAAGLGNPQLIGTVRTNQGNICAHQKRWADAAANYALAVAAYREMGHGHDAVEAMTGLGRASHQLGRADEAAGYLRAAEMLAGELGNDQLLAQVRGALAETGATLAGSLPDGLTARQAEVLRLLAAGMSNKEIAAALYLSPSTVERHLATIYRKLGVAGRVDATRYALAHGLAPAAP